MWSASPYTRSLPDVQVVINEVRKRNPRAHHPGRAPTIMTDAIGLTGVDSICTGDGDDVIVDLVNALDEEEPEGIAELWFKDADGTIVKNAAHKELRDISADLARPQPLRYRDYWVPGAKQPRHHGHHQPRLPTLPFCFDPSSTGCGDRQHPRRGGALHLAGHHRVLLRGRPVHERPMGHGFDRIEA